MKNIDPTPTRCAIYARISDDKRGEGLGVERQKDSCHVLAASNGWEVALVEVDNSISAYSGKPRPAYMRMMDAIRNHEIDAVIVWNLDRLYRRMKDLEEYIDLVEDTGVLTHTVMAGAFDLNTAMGRAMARTSIAFATLEVDNSKDRVLSAKLQAAKAGKPSGGNRGYGYEQNGMVIIESEAVIVREVIDRFVRGESWQTIATDLNSRAVPTAKGNKWCAANVRNVAIRPRNIAIRVHNNDEYPAQWPPVISLDTWEDLQLALKRGQAINGKRSYSNKHLLKGFVHCGRCGCRMHIVNAQQRDGSYSPAFGCRKRDYRGDEVGCGRMKRRKVPLEDFIADCIMYRLDSPELGVMLEDVESNTPALKKLLRDHEMQARRLRDVLECYATGELTLDEYKTAKVHAQSRLDTLGREIDARSAKTTVAKIPAGQSVREAWDNADMPWRRQLVDTVIEKIHVDPRVPGKKTPLYKKKWQFDPDLIRIEWKV
ncbi:recombinase family protein [Arthrobacter sp. lap29]|uniref:recombinase family protein n=1 Tax=Arthrobacter sp. lap29 TaxID=3056122 RepID=UPI0028F7014D|nr:recombinase family protein [Arthrobacter sp. lap29]